MGLTNSSVGRSASQGGFEATNLPVIALAGNPNVGKSTVFNALTGMHQHTGNWGGKTVAAADCLVPGIGEIIGGSQREERLELLEGRIKELGMKPEDYWWYCDLRRYGSCKHAGFGLGFERLVMYLTGVSNIRDVELHPRTVGNADF